MPRPTAPRVDAADMDARCLDLRRAGLSYREIARTVGLSVSNVHGRVMRGLDRTRREPADALRELELARLDALQEALTRVLGRAHVTVSGGKVVMTEGDDGQEMPLLDDGPTIAAAQALVRVQESRRKLLGLDAPARVEARVLSIDELDMQIKELETLLGETADREGADLYQRQHERATKLVEDLAGQAGVDYHERKAVHDRAFWNAWKGNRRAVRDVPGVHRGQPGHGGDDPGPPRRRGGSPRRRGRAVPPGADSVSLFDRFRYAIAGMRRRPGTTLVRVGRFEPLPRPRPRRALPSPEHPICRRCGIRHEPRPHPAAGGGLAATYGRTILPDPTRPEPLGRGPAHDKAVYRDQVSAWQYGTPDPPPSMDLAEIREEFYAPRVYWWEERDS
jgi:hypothetical protein